VSAVRIVPALLVVGALLAAGCGSDDEPAVNGGGGDVAATQTATAPVQGPPQTVTEQVAPPPATSAATATAPAPAPTQPEEAPGGAGDEEGIVTSARFTLGADGSLTPESAEVPAFLNAAVVVDNQDDEAHQLEVGDRGAPLPAGRTTTLQLPGRAATELPVVVDGNEEAVLRIVAERP
jgi:hypothetical protein